MKLSKKTLKIIKKCMVFVLWALVLYAAFNIKLLYDLSGGEMTIRYEVKSYERFPDIAYQQIALYNKVYNLIMFGIVMACIFQVVDYYYEPETHWFHKIKKFAEKYINKMEED